jgi:hypothetical protein
MSPLCKNTLDMRQDRSYVHIMFRYAIEVWNEALAHNTRALGFIMAEILAMLQVYGGTDATTLPRAVHASILRVLRPAESALRRLIVIAARDLVVGPVPPEKKAGQAGTGKTSRGKPASRIFFQLVDPRKRFSAQRVVYATLVPRISVIAPGAPIAPLFAQPQDPHERPSIPSASDRHISAHRLCLRLKALTSALEDIPRHAVRLARWRMKRKAQQPPRFSSPLRFGNPPGYRAKPRHEIDDILAACHKFALGVLNEAKPNTS